MVEEGSKDVVVSDDDEEKVDEVLEATKVVEVELYKDVVEASTEVGTSVEIDDVVEASVEPVLASALDVAVVPEPITDVVAAVPSRFPLMVPSVASMEVQFPDVSE